MSAVIILGVLVLALFAIIIWRNRGPYTPPSDHQIQPATPGDSNFLLYAGSNDDDRHFQGDDHDHGPDFSNSMDSSDSGGSDGGGSD